jgi:AbrB family looped-hinge helix DNA binding protein
MMEKTEVQRRFTTTIPKKVRERLGLKEGMDLFWDVEEGRIVVYPLSYASLEGVLKGRVDYTRKAKEEVEERFLGSRKSGKL